MKAPTDLLRSDNWFHWEFNMRMTLAKKGLLEHIVVEKSDDDDDWKVKDLKAFAIIAQGIELQHQTKIRRAATAKQAWETLVEFYNRANLQNRVALMRRLHEFVMEAGSSMATHLDRFDELVVTMEAVGEQVNETRQLVILLGSLPSEYEVFVSIVENAASVTLLDVKEKLFKEYERMRTKEATETAFKARVNGGRPRENQKRSFTKPKSRSATFTGECFECNKRGHKAADCREKKNADRDISFMANENERDGWLVDSGASSHMTPYRADFRALRKLEKEIKITIADGATLSAVGTGDVEM